MLKENLKELVDIVSSSEGISVEALLQALSYSVPKRTLQYRLAQLVKEGLLVLEGAGKKSKYYIKKPLENRPVSNYTIPFSKEAINLQKKVSLPVPMRPHVSYQRDFLEFYEPNKTHYLSPAIVKKLFALGNGKEKGRPAGTYARRIYQRLLIDLSWNSSRLEGNTYSILETEKLLATGEIAPGKNKMDAQMLLNHKEAIEFIVDLAEEISINRSTILNIHGLLSHDLLTDPSACGRLRHSPVKIGQSVYYPLEVPQLIEDYFGLIINKAAAIKNPFEQSFFLMVHLPYLQPFLDVNKRVSRLAGNIPLIRENLCPLSFIDVPEVDYIQGLLAIYELNRMELFRDVFVWAYERSASLYQVTLEALGEPDPFRVRYRNSIQEVVQQVIKNKRNKTEAAETIQKFAEETIPNKDQHRFIEIAEIEVRSLHEGNFARFHIRPSEFFAWQEQWR